MSGQETFSISVDPEGYVRLVLVDADTEAHLEELRAFSNTIVETIKNEEERIHEKVRTLVDLSHLTKYSPKAIGLIVEVLGKTHPHTLKTATFGAKPNILLAQQAVSALAGRDNLRPFKTEHEAKMWLLAKQ